MILLMLACSQGELSISPNPLSWGEVDFHDADPDECDPDEGGCAPMDVTLQNDGEGTLDITGRDFDDEHICVQGFAPGPLAVGELAPGSRYVLRLSVCGYGPGERDSEVSGQIVFDVEGGAESTATLDWSFVPIRDIAGDDTAG